MSLIQLKFTLTVNMLVHVSVNRNVVSLILKVANNTFVNVPVGPEKYLNLSFDFSGFEKS